MEITEKELMRIMDLLAIYKRDREYVVESDIYYQENKDLLKREMSDIKFIERLFKKYGLKVV